MIFFFLNLDSLKITTSFLNWLISDKNLAEFDLKKNQAKFL